MRGQVAPKSVIIVLLMCNVGCASAPEIEEDLRLTMIPIPAGTFVMGDVIEQSHPDALPLHQVTVDPFRLSKYETTFAQYDAFAKATGRPLPPDDAHGRGRRAVINVSWSDAAAFCRHHGFRLPSEGEWEYAARDAGRKRVYAGTDDPDSLSAYAFTASNSLGFSMPVGMKLPTALGLHDMTGNASEWVGAYYESYPENGEEPQWKDLDSPGFRITRGGSFSTSGHAPEPALTTRTYWRAGTLDDVTSFAIGFRCAD